MEPLGLPANVYAAGLVFARVGALVMLIPGIGEAFVPPRVRLGLALLLALCVAPIAAHTLPPIPSTVGEMGGQVLKELLIGLMLGALLRIFLAALSVAGEVIALQTTLAFAQTANPLQAQPGGAIASFLSLLGLVLLFATDMHHLFIAAIARSYTLFAPASHVLVQDAATVALQAVSATFSLGVQMAAPLMVFALVFNVALGLVGRVMPQFQVFFAGAPLTLLLGLSMFALSLGAGMLIWLDRYREFLRLFT
ncbi:MAG TPA: flagellar biosynthetic protein FliR [Caulobacteraceae bacterium]